MGAWGPGPFDNDDALDYLDMFEESGGLAATLALGDGEDELEGPDGSMIVAAAEVVACLLGRPRDQDTLELVHELVDAHGPADAALVSAARAGVERVLGEGSELRALWADSADHAAWRDTLADLQRRLAG